MRIKAALTALLLAASPAFAQQLNPTTQINWPLITGQGTPTSLNLACTSQVGLTVNITTSGGVVTGASIAAGGSGILVVPQTVNLLGGGGTGALLTITAASGGAATAITVTAGGSGYSNTSAVRASLGNFGQPFQNLAVTPNTYYTCGNDGWAVRGGASSLSLTTTGTSGAASLSGSVLNVPQYQAGLTLTTTGSSGPATLSGGTLNIPQYSGGTCAIGTCILNAGTASQTITESSGFNLGRVGTSWGINTVFNNAVDFSEMFGNFNTDTTDTGGSGGRGGAALESQLINFNNPGYNWGYSVNNSTQWFTAIGNRFETHDNAAGIGAAASFTLNKPSVGDPLGMTINVLSNGGCQALSDECTTGIRNVVQEGPSSGGLVVSGGTTGSQSMVVNINQPIGVGRIIYDQTATTGVISTTQTLGSATAGIQTVNLGTTVAQSTCGILAGGPIVATTAYSITSNVITITGTNSLYQNENILLSGYGTSTFLNGQSVFVIASTGTSFTAGFTHANVGPTTEAGAFNTVNVDTPRQANNGSISMTFGITLGSAYVGSTTALITAGGQGFIDTSQLSAVGSYTGGVQYVTASLIHPILSGATVCMGGLAGYGELNTTSPFGGYINFILGSPTTTSALTTAIPFGRPTGGYAKAGGVTLYPIAIVQSIVPGGTPTIAVTPNSVAWANGDTISIPNGITANYTSQVNEMVNNNPYATYTGIASSYAGPATFLGGSLFQAVAGETVSTLTSQGGLGFAPNLMNIIGHVGMGLNFQTRPSDPIFNGVVFPNSLIEVGGCPGGFTCPASYYLHTDGTNANPSMAIQVTPAPLGVPGPNVYNFMHNGAGYSTIIQQDGVAVCLQSGTNCPSSGTGISGLTAGFIPLAGSSTTLTGNSPLDYGITTALTLTSTAPLAITTASGLGGGFNGTEGTAPTGATSVDDLWADSTAHRLKENANNAGGIILSGIASAATAGHCPQFATNGIDLTDSGSACGGGGSAFSALTSGTNSTAAMVVGTGGSLAVSGTGTIAATTTNAIAGNVTFSTGLSTTGAGTIASPYVVTTTGAGATTLASVAAGLAPASSGLYDFNNNQIQDTAAWTLTTSSTATSGANFASANMNWIGSIWNGSAGIPDTMTLSNQVGTGANPTAFLTLGHSGTSGVAGFAAPIINTTNGYECAGSFGSAGQVLTSGGASLPCTWGAGGSGVTSVTGVTNQTTSSGGTTPAIGLSSTIVFPGTISSATAGAASTPAAIFTGAPFAGTSTNALPLFYFNTGASAPTTFSTTGTYLGFNTASGCTTTEIFDVHLNGGTSLANLTCAGGLNLRTIAQTAGGLFAVASSGSTTVFDLKPVATQTSVNCSTSGTVVFSEPIAGSSLKNVEIFANACLGTASYTYPTAFTNTPQVLSQSLAAVATSVSTTAVTITGTTTTGFLKLDGY